VVQVDATNRFYKKPVRAGGVMFEDPDKYENDEKESEKEDEKSDCLTDEALELLSSNDAQPGAETETNPVDNTAAIINALANQLILDGVTTEKEGRRGNKLPPAADKNNAEEKDRPGAETETKPVDNTAAIINALANQLVLNGVDTEKGGRRGNKLTPAADNDNPVEKDRLSEWHEKRLASKLRSAPEILRDLLLEPKLRPGKVVSPESPRTFSELDRFLAGPLTEKNGELKDELMKGIGDFITHGQNGWFSTPETRAMYVENVLNRSLAPGQPRYSVEYIPSTFNSLTNTRIPDMVNLCQTRNGERRVVGTCSEVRTK
jgi:hypothetical protein